MMDWDENPGKYGMRLGLGSRELHSEGDDVGLARGDPPSAAFGSCGMIC